MKTLTRSIAFSMVLAVPMVSQATLLHFDGLGLANYGDIQSNLGSFANTPVTGVSQGSGWTPNVGVSMSTVNGLGVTQASNLDYWSTSYGDLNGVAFATFNGGFSRVNLAATPGYLVTLNSFDLGGYPTTNLAAARIRVYDAGGNIVWDRDGSTVNGAGPSHSSYFPNFTDTSLTLEYGSNWNIGLDNLDFSQAVAVPEPLTLGILGAGVAGLLRRRRKS